MNSNEIILLVTYLVTGYLLAPVITKTMRLMSGIALSILLGSASFVLLFIPSIILTIYLDVENAEIFFLVGVVAGALLYKTVNAILTNRSGTRAR